MKRLSMLLLFTIMAYGESTPLSTQKQEILQLKREQIKRDMGASTKSWISPLNLSLSINKSEDATKNNIETKKGAVEWSQDLFRSGGIYYTIEQAKASGEANLLGVDSEESTYLKQIYTLKAQVERDKLSLEQEQLTLKNMDIDLFIIKAKYKVGTSDISELNQATINRDNARTSMIVTKNALHSETYELKKLIDKINIDSIEIPEFPTISKDEYIDKNIELLQYKQSDIAKEASWKNTRSGYLPKLTFNASYGYTDYSSDTTDYNGNAYSYGATLSMPLDINTNDSIESARLQFLQTKSSQADRRAELQEEYAKRISNIEDYKEKISVAQEMITMYTELYDFTKQQASAGFKSSYDLESLGNSLKIQELEEKIQNYNITIEKISLYFDVKH
ncbi:TolC family protein [bacterium]|nr:TolC family protein [bacterium]MBU1884396.1 TolC family protein [bacterium]